MKRRNFLKGLIATPAVAKAVDFDQPVEVPGWEPTMYDYGEIGVMWIEIFTTNDHPKQYKVVTRCPENDWLDECEKLSEGVFGPFKAHHFGATGNPTTIYFPVNALTYVAVYEDDLLIDQFQPVYDPEFECFNGFGAPVKGAYPPNRYADVWSYGSLDWPLERIRADYFDRVRSI